MTRIAVVGAGYVGLVSGVCMADLGHEVTCVERDPGRVATLISGRSPIHEVGLQALIAANLGDRFSVTDDLRHAVVSADATMIAVGTPSTELGIDLSQLEAAAAEVGAALAGSDRFHVVIVKSTVTPGTTESVVGPILERESGRRIGVDLGIASNPEFLTEGQAVRDFMEPDRIVIGASDDRTAQSVRDIYGVFPDVPVITTNPRTAEMIKYASNALLATLISFTNELANIGAAVGGIDSVAVMRGVNASHYLTTRTEAGSTTASISAFLHAGCGFGGSCLPKDVLALSQFANAQGVPAPMLNAVLTVNERQSQVFSELVLDALAQPADATVGILGLAFKPGTNDVRESPAFRVIREIHSRVANIIAHDPVVRADDLPADIAEAVELVVDLQAVVARSDVLVIVTAWDQYRLLPEMVARRQRPPAIVDGRRMLDPASVPIYSGVGL